MKQKRVSYLWQAHCFDSLFFSLRELFVWPLSKLTAMQNLVDFLLQWSAWLEGKADENSVLSNVEDNGWDHCKYLIFTKSIPLTNPCITWNDYCLSYCTEVPSSFYPLQKQLSARIYTIQISILEKYFTVNIALLIVQHMPHRQSICSKSLYRLTKVLHQTSTKAHS